MQIVAIRRHTATAKEQHLIRRMHELRARVFRQRLNWDVHVESEQEFDEYDRLDPTYLLAVTGEGRVAGCARIMPSTGPTMLGRTFPFLLDGSSMPQSPTIVESSRFSIDRDNSAAAMPNGLSVATRTMFAGIIEWSMANGHDRIVTVTDIRFERILRRANWPLERLGLPRPVDNTVAVAGLLPADEPSFAEVRPPSYISMFAPAIKAAA